MLKIGKMQNVYGIKNLLNPELLNGNTIIYAPNGVMKSSLADGLETISRNQKPNDAFFGVNCDFEISINGDLITNTSPNTEFPILVFSEKSSFTDVLSDPDITRLVLDESLKDKFNECLKNVENISEKYSVAFSKNVLEDKKYSAPKTKLIMKEVFGGKYEIQTLLNIDKSDDILPRELSEIEYQSIFNKDTDEIIRDPDFTSKTSDYLSLFDKKLNEVVFNNGFGINELQAVNETLKKNMFYSAGHKVVIGTENFGYEDILKLIETTIIDIYSSNELKLKFDEIKKVLNKNKSTKALATLMEKEPKLLNELNQPDKFKKKLIWAKMKDSIPDFDSDKTILDETQKKIVEIQKEAMSVVSVWQKVVDTYNARFLNKAFSISISNKENAVLGVDLPQFIKTFPGTEISIDPEMQKRLSTGERRAITILNFIFQIELMERKKEPFLLVLDDIVDSFDYKNKFALIEYVNNIAENTDIQLLILTHNFDFYRSCRLSLGEKLDSKIIAYNYDGEVTFFDNKSTHFIGFGYFFDWKNRGTDLSVYALVPFVRNLIHLELGSHDPDYLLITDFLHYNRLLETRDLGVIEVILKKYGIKLSTTYKSSLFCDKLIEVAKPFLANNRVDETKLEAKIILGYLTRILSDRFMFLKYYEINSVDPAFGDDLGYSRKLFNSIKGNLSSLETTTLVSSFTIAPSFIHVNSFMYEPLIDVGSDKLIEVTKNLLQINGISL